MAHDHKEKLYIMKKNLCFRKELHFSRQTFGWWLNKQRCDCSPILTLSLFFIKSFCSHAQKEPAPPEKTTVNGLTIGRFCLHCGVVFTFIYLLMYIFKSFMTFLFVMIVTRPCFSNSINSGGGAKKESPRSLPQASYFQHTHQ